MLHKGSKVRVGYNPTSQELYITQDGEATETLVDRNKDNGGLRFGNIGLLRYLGIDNTNGTFRGQCTTWGDTNIPLLIFDLSTQLLELKRKKAPL